LLFFKNRHAGPALIGSMLAELFEVPLRDLGGINAQLEGILCPEPEVGVEKVGITQQFLSDAATYHSRYSNSAHFCRLFEQALIAADITIQPNMTVLDIGTGSGTNTIQPCLTLFEGCRIVATDLSPDLLRILRHYVVGQRLGERIVCVCTDAMNNYFKPASFDLVVGAAILHHLLDPLCALVAAHRALKPGGIAFFFEPFEGLAVLRVAFNLILERATREAVSLDQDAAKLLAAMSLDYATRAGSDKTAPHFKHMDDKWLFTRAWLEGASRQAGFSTLTIVRHASHVTLFRDYTVELLRLGANLTPDALPLWAWETIGQFDEGFSSEMKADLLLEGTIVLRKSTE
jgi:SAM-dependent methyltransferase